LSLLPLPLLSSLTSLLSPSHSSLLYPHFYLPSLSLSLLTPLPSLLLPKRSQPDMVHALALDVLLQDVLPQLKIPARADLTLHQTLMKETGEEK